MKMLMVLVLCVVAAFADEKTSNIITLKDLYESTVSFDERIIGGTQATVGQFPYQVAVTMRTSSGSSFCGGSLLDSRWVLTAAHCARGALSFTLYLGGTTLSSSESGRVTVTTSTFIVHPQYNTGNLNNDIALIRMDNPITFNNRIQPVRLPSRGSTLEANVSVRVSGWGRTSNTGGVSNNLNWVDVTTIANTRCAQVYGSSVVVSSTVCAVGNPHHSTCNGDSGGPLVTASDGVQHGVVSFVHSSGCSSGNPSGYVRVESFLTWISQNTGISV